MANSERIMSFGEHLEELRTRLIFALIGVVLLFVLGLVFGGRLMEIMSAPLLAELRAAGQSPTLLATSPLESFAAYVKVAAVAALVLGMPWVLYQAWLFVAPGLYPQEQRFVYVLLPLSAMLTVVGMLLLYFIVLPLSLYFLISFGATLIDAHVPPAAELTNSSLPQLPVLAGDPPGVPVGTAWVNSTLGQLRVQVDATRVMGLPLTSGGMIQQQYRISEYMDLVFMLGLAFAVTFQVPLVLLLLSWAGFLRPGDLTPYRRYVMFGCVIGAALLPTQDPGSLLILATIMYALFELGIVLMRIVPVRRPAPLAGAAAMAAAGTDGNDEA